MEFKELTETEAREYIRKHYSNATYSFLCTLIKFWGGKSKTNIVFRNELERIKEEKVNTKINIEFVKKMKDHVFGEHLVYIFRTDYNMSLLGSLLQDKNVMFVRNSDTGTFYYVVNDQIHESAVKTKQYDNCTYDLHYSINK